MGIKLIFIKDESATDIEVVVRAKSRDDEVERIMRSIGEDVIVRDRLSDEDDIDLNDVVIISKSGRYLSVRTAAREYVVKEPLYKIEEKLDKTRFVRISQSEIVNLKQVEKWSFDGGGIIKIQLKGDIVSYTSRRYAVAIRKVLKARV